LAKKKREKPRREFTRRQLSRWQQQKRRQRIILSLGIFVIVAALIIVGSGWYINEYQPLHQTVIRVNDTEFDMDYYVKMIKLYGKGQPTILMPIVADSVITTIQQNELIRQAALKMDIIISQDEVDEELKRRDPPLGKDYREIVRAEMLIDKLREEYFENEVPLYSEQRHIMAMLLESEAQADEVRLRLEAGESFGDLTEEFSVEALTQAESGDLGWRPRDVLTILLGTPILEEYAFSSEAGVLSQPVYDEEITTEGGYWLIKVVAIEDNRLIEDNDRDLLKAVALNDWASSLWDDPENIIEVYLDSSQIAWAVEKALRG